MRARVWVTVLMLGVLVLAAGCSRFGDDSSDEGTATSVARDTGLLTDRTLTVDGMGRVYDLYVPDGQSQQTIAAPLVILLHANRSSRDDITGESRAVSPYALWRDIADEEGLLLLIPQGVEGPEGHTGWNDCRSDSAGNPETDDVLFVVEAIDAVSEIYDVDSDRVFASGTSNGGHMAIRLAQEIPDRLAGIAVIAAGMPANSECPSSSVPVSALFMVGSDDPIAPYDGGAMASNRGEILSAGETEGYWLARNGINSGLPALTTFDDIDTSDGSTVGRQLSEGGTNGTSVSMYRVIGGGHAEPSISAQYRRLFERVVGNQNHDIEMALEVWAFFATVTPG